MMKTTLNIILVIIMLLTACQQIVDTAPNELETKSNVTVIADLYDFPIKPGTPAWAKLQSHNEMVEVCQLPQDTLKNISTAGLIQTVLNYPLLSDMFAFDETQSGFDSVASQFNGLPELMQRENAATLIAQFYSTLSPERAVGQDLVEQGEYSFHIAHTEILLAQYPILAQISVAELEELAGVTWQFLETKSSMPDIYGAISIESSILLLARIMQTAEYQPFLEMLENDQGAAYFVREITPAQNKEDLAMLQEIAGHAKQFVSRSTHNMIPIQTISIDLTSGMPPPEWLLNTEEVETIEQTLSALPLTDAASFFDGLGYRGFLIQLQSPERLIRIQNGYVLIDEGGSQKMYIDENNQFEKWLLDISKTHIEPQLYSVLEEDIGK